MRTLLLIALVLLPTSAEAHRPNIKTNLLRLDGSSGLAFVEIRPQLPGRITLRMAGTPKSGTLVLKYRFQSTESLRTYQLDDVGSGLQAFELGIANIINQSKIETVSIEVFDSINVLIASVGGISSSTKPVLTWPLVYVTDSVSDICFTRGGDTFLFPNGKWTIGFDALRTCSTQVHLNNTGNRAEIEYRVNNGPWITDSITFDVQSGKSRPNGRPGKYLGLQSGDRILVKRVEVFDPNGTRFATMGVRMGSQGHYREP